MPRPFREVVTVSIRFDSFARNSSCARDHGSPRGPSPRRARTAAARRSAPAPRRRSTAVAASSAERISRSPAGSPASRRRLKTAIRAPMRSSTSSRPVRGGMRLTPWIRRSEPASSVAATTRRSRRREVAGNSSEKGASRSTGQTLACRARLDAGAHHRQEPLGVVARLRAARRHGRPVVRVEAGEQHADFTCALATGSSYEIGRSAPPPRTVIGA